MAWRREIRLEHRKAVPRRLLGPHWPILFHGLGLMHLNRLIRWMRLPDEGESEHIRYEELLHRKTTEPVVVSMSKSEVRKARCAAG